MSLLEFLLTNCVTLSSLIRYLDEDESGRCANFPDTCRSISLNAWNCSASRFLSFNISAKLSNCVNANCSDILS